MIAVTLVLMLAALCCSHFFSACETAFFSLKKTHLVSLKPHDTRRRRAVASLVKRPEELLLTVLLGNMVVNVFYASLSVLAAFEIAGGKLSVALGAELGALVMLILGGEILPKYIALSNPSRMSLAFSIPLLVFHKAAAPAVAVAGRVSRGLTDILVPRRRRPEVTADEFDAILELGEDRGVINSSEEDFLQGILDMKETRVSEIMTPRVDLAVVTADMTRNELEVFARKEKRSKFPVLDGDIDSVAGVLHAKDLIFSSGRRVSDLIKPVEFVPENSNVGDLLATLRREMKNFAVVVDEYGGTAGVVTLEDVMEEVVGEIEDKYDQEQPQVRRIEPGSFVVSGGLSIRDWNDEFGTDIDEDDIDTIAGHMMSVLDRTPRQGDTIRCGSLKLTASKVERRRITEISVEKAKKQ